MSLTKLNENSEASYGGYRDIVPASAANLLQHLRLVDVRNPSEYTGELGHIQGAELVPLPTVEAQAVGWKKDQPILVICRSGGRSAMASSALARMGFTNVYNLAGGMIQWNACGLPAVNTPAGSR